MLVRYLLRIDVGKSGTSVQLGNGHSVPSRRVEDSPLFLTKGWLGRFHGSMGRFPQPDAAGHWHCWVC